MKVRIVGSWGLSEVGMGLLDLAVEDRTLGMEFKWSIGVCELALAGVTWVEVGWLPGAWCDFLNYRSHSSEVVDFLVG